MLLLGGVGRTDRPPLMGSATFADEASARFAEDAGALDVRAGSASGAFPSDVTTVPTTALGVVYILCEAHQCARRTDKDGRLGERQVGVAVLSEAVFQELCCLVSMDSIFEQLVAL